MPNDMRDRLIELLKIPIYPREDADPAEVVADYLLDSGVVLPPCKVGDVVWDRNGEPHKIVSIEWYSKKVMHLHCEHHTFSVGKRSLGKTVFLTKEEAEAKLKEHFDK